MDILHRCHGEHLSEKMRIAAFVQMLPRNFREVVCQSLDAGSAEGVVERVVRYMQKYPKGERGTARV